MAKAQTKLRSKTLFECSRNLIPILIRYPANHLKYDQPFGDLRFDHWANPCRSFLGELLAQKTWSVQKEGRLSWHLGVIDP